MNTQPAILVVDDEQVVCDSCNRILREEGFRVESSTDVLHGLAMAEANDYAAILLDIRMEGMDGLEFLHRLRVRKPGVPVIIITGYPSPESRAVSRRRGARDYLCKPFTPEEITRSVKRVVDTGQPLDEPLPVEVQETSCGVDTAVDDIQPACWRFMPGPPQFLDEAWLRQCADGQVCLGAFLPRMHGAQVDGVRLPRTSDEVHRGLPLAVLRGRAGRSWSIPSPMSGTVTDVHRFLADNPGAFWQEPFRNGWIARIRPTRPGHELAAAATRRVLLVCGKRNRARILGARLANLGCEVHDHGIDPEPAVFGDPGVLVVDAASCGRDGPRTVTRLKAARPDGKAIILGDGDPQREASYRELGVFYYAVEPFEDMEIADILFDAFRAPAPQVEEESHTALLPEYLSRIHITNRRGRKVSLLADRHLLARRQGLGQRLVAGILGRFCPLQTTLGAHPADLGEDTIRDETGTCDVLVVLTARDAGAVPGNVTMAPAPCGRRGDVRIEVQPDEPAKRPLSFDPRTTQALADLILGLMM